MTEQPAKLAVLTTLESCSAPVSLSELLVTLGDGYAERTVRRWLTEFIAQGLVEKSGNKRSTRYCLASQNTAPIDGLFSATAAEVIAAVRKPIFERIPTSYDFDWFDSYQPNETFYLTQIQRAQLEQAGQRSQSQEPAGTYARKIFNRLLIDLSYNSSRLEGNTYSLIETDKLLN